MCGIAGVVRTSGEPVAEETLRAMVSAMRRRGPDAEGYRIFSDERVQAGLGHCRLSILDLSDLGRQPMRNEDGTVWITFNGEIYNYPELRDELEAKGHAFRSASDTECIIHGYEEWGENVFERLNGMFALGVYDETRRSLLLARDRFGKKPLYYFRLPDGGLCFASELRALERHPAFVRSLDMDALSSYLLFEYAPGDRSIAKGVRKLPAGSLLRWSGGEPEVRAYYEPDLEREEARLTEEEAAEEILRLLRGAVKRRLLSDVPLGVFLSGGMDSSAIAALMTELSPRTEVSSFSIGFREASFDESRVASGMAARLGARHRSLVLDADAMLDALPEIWDVLDEPMADPSIIPTFLLARFARRHVTVALGGDGGDELFAGYDPFVAEKLAWLYDWTPQWLRRGVVRPLCDRLPVGSGYMSLDFKLRQFIRGMEACPRTRHQVWLGSFLAAEQRALFRKDVAPALDPLDDVRRTMGGRRFRDRISEVLFFYQRFYLAGHILAKVDVASMANSLEARSPFLDKDLADFVNGLPSRFKIRRLVRKRLLKSCLKGVVPEEILRRRKKGFGIPLTSWLGNQLKPLLRETLSRESLLSGGLFAPAAVERLLTEHFEGRRDNRKQIWTLFVFEMWRRRRGYSC